MAAETTNPEKALMRSLVDLLRTRLGLKGTECDESATGRPPPGAGKVFVAVHPTRVAWERLDPCRFKQTIDLAVTVSRRLAPSALDKAGRVALDGDQGLSDRCRSIADLVVAEAEAWKLAARALLAPGSAELGRVPEPVEIGPPVEQDRTWYSVTDESDDDIRRVVGLTRVIALAGGTAYGRSSRCR